MRKLKFIKVRPEDVKEYGTSSAIILGLIEGWCDYHQRKNIKLTEYYWSGYMTYEMIEDQTGIPARTARRRIKDLVDKGIITWACFSKVSYDQRRWYRRVEQVSKMDTTPPSNMDTPTVQNGHMEGSKMDATITNTSTNTSSNTSITNTISSNTGQNLLKQYEFAEDKSEFIRWLENVVSKPPIGRKDKKIYQERVIALEIIKQQYQ